MDNDILNFLRKQRTMILSTDGIKIWSTKVYYSLYSGIIFFIEKTGLTLSNIEKNKYIAYEIDNNDLSIIVQGNGNVEILGLPGDHTPERDILINKNPEDRRFVDHVYIARLIPVQMNVTDLRNGLKKYQEIIKTDELVEQVFL